MDSGKAAREKIYARVLKDIKPSKLEIEGTIANANRVMAKLKSIVPKNVKLVIAGSIARSTNLKGDHDIDIFMLFDKKVPKKTLERQGIAYAKKVMGAKEGKFEIKYAQHPYARLHLKEIDMRVDVVPAYKIDSIEELATAVDRTPLHTRFINDHLSDRQRDDVRLLKYLLKTHNIYGAEAMTQGFSGYLCELMVHSFGSLDNLLENAVRFRSPLALNPKNMAEKIDKSIFKKFNSEFVVIDPVDKDRNVAAGVSQESLARFMLVAKEFLDKPDAKVFLGAGFSHSDVRKRVDAMLKASGLHLYLIETKIPDKSEDIIWPQLRKASDIIAAEAKKRGFDIYMRHVWVDSNMGYIAYLAPHEANMVRLYCGPSAFHGLKNTEAFLDAHKNAVAIMFDGERINALDHSDYHTLEHLLLAVTKGRLIERRKDILLKG
ncbi:MAG: CCA tRNA nucleotidyltransferase, partial [Candidatus Micrarchaeota archaeon]|nr:CCA tRNA nucleotidyltransferase [Candidatus Micrarchaeota archaeon]